MVLHKMKWTHYSTYEVEHGGFSCKVYEECPDTANSYWTYIIVAHDGYVVADDVAQFSTSSAAMLAVESWLENATCVAYDEVKHG
jgi:hypothetical protein